MRFKHGHNRRGIIGNKNPRWKGGRYLSYHGYDMIMSKGHPRADKDGYVYGHILVYEEYYKCCVLQWAAIHHINGIKNDNRIENLKGMMHSMHSSEHRVKEIVSGKILFGGINRWGQTVTQYHTTS